MYGDKGSPYLKPLEGEKGSNLPSLKKTSYDTLEIKLMIKSINSKK